MTQASNLIQKIAAASLIASIFLPSIALGATTTPKNGGGNFCTNVDTVSARLVTALTNRQNNADTRIDARTATTTARWANRDQVRATNRAQRDQDWAAVFVKLDARATTTAQHEAVATFKTTVTGGLTTKRAAVDAAVSEFRVAVDAKLASRKSGVDAALAAFKVSVDAAVAKAKTDCAANVDSSTVRQNFRTSIDAARATLKSALPATKIKADIKALAATRDQKIKAAQDAFKTLVTSARATLKASLHA